MIRLLKQTVAAWTELVFPLRSDARTVRNLKLDTLATLPRSRGVKSIRALLPFTHPFVRACVHEVKYHRNEAATTLLGGVLHDYLKDQTTDTVVIPIPLSTERLRQRGYNQSELIGTLGTKGTTAQVDNDILYRERDTTPQTTLSRKDRIKNLTDAFAVYDTKTARTKIKGVHIIVLDDVTTTGATLEAARAALAPHSPASITLLAIAH